MLRVLRGYGVARLCSTSYHATGRGSGCSIFNESAVVSLSLSFINVSRRVCRVMAMLLPASTAVTRVKNDAI